MVVITSHSISKPSKTHKMDTFCFFSVKPSISTIRPLEKTKRIDYNQGFDYSSLIAHVTQNSIPSVVSCLYKLKNFSF